MIDTLVADARPIDGLRFRLYGGEEDLPPMLGVYTAAHEADGLEEVTTFEQFRLNYATLVNCDPARDILLAEVDDQLVAYSRVFWQDLVEGGRHYECFGFIRPEWRHRGIGGAMLRHNEARLHEIASAHDVEPKWFSSEGVDTDAGNVALPPRSASTPTARPAPPPCTSRSASRPSGPSPPTASRSPARHHLIPRADERRVVEPRDRQICVRRVTLGLDGGHVRARPADSYAARILWVLAAALVASDPRPA